jgi:aminopeptidase N
VLVLDQASQEFVFDHVAHEPVLSALRNFSAPVRLNVAGQGDEQLLFLFAHDSDPFNRWARGPAGECRCRGDEERGGTCDDAGEVVLS